MNKFLYWARGIVLAVFACGFAMALNESIQRQLANPPSLKEFALATAIALLVGFWLWRDSRRPTPSK